MDIFKKTFLWRGLVIAFTVILCIMVIIAYELESNKEMIDGFFGTVSSKIVTAADDESTLYTAFVPDDEYLTDGKGDTDKMIQLHKDLSRQLSAEGSVLLKNNGGLPLAKGSKVTMLGIRSYTMITGAGSGYGVASGQDIQLRTALADAAGANFKINPTMLEVYRQIGGVTSSGDRPAGYNFTTSQPQATDPKEPSLTDLNSKNSAYQNSFSEYNDAAIVVVGRASGEGTDFCPGESGAVAGSGARNALALTNNEKNIIDLACSKFNKVIVLVNTNSAMEIQSLKENSKIKGILWIGHPGNYGSLGIADILCGDANPSGGLYDIYSSHTMSSPAMMNMGHYVYSNANQITRAGVMGTSNTDWGLKNYIIEAEGIYVGYRYYETRYYDCVVNPGSNAGSTAGTFDSNGNWNYSKEVTYGFGFGLSYSDFTQTIGTVTLNQTPHSLTATVPVTVKNSGGYAGKSIVQIYAQVPYTEYDKTNKVEKSAVQLVAFDKTKTLAPGATETMTITVDFQDLASYDYKNAKTYILDGGDYFFATGNGAHEALNNILAKQGKTTANGMDQNGDASKVYVYKYSPSGGVDKDRFSVSKANTAVTNQLQYSDWNDYKDGTVTHLSRSDWSGTWPKSYVNLEIPTAMLDHLNGNYIKIKTDDDVSTIKFEQPSENGLAFGNLKFSDFDDPRWKELIDHLTLDETIDFAFHGGRIFSDLKSINFLGGHWAENGTCGVGGSMLKWTASENDPWGIPTTDRNAGYNCRVFCSAPVVASTFNPELSYEMGKMYGNNAIFCRLPVFWGPGLNTHRNPYNGRNGEYFSEDPVLSGYIGKEVVMGALEKGLICAPKHFAFNDQETHRGGIAPFMTEQRAREIELRAFQIPFEAGMQGCMLSFSKIGGIECTASKGLLTNILRNEWGFNGYVVTDMNDDFDLAPQSYAAGLTCFDINTGVKPADLAPFMKTELFNTDVNVLKGLKEAVKRNLYVFSQSNMMNFISSTSYRVSVMTWWRMTYIVGLSVSGGLTVCTLGLYVASLLLSNKKRRVNKNG